MFLAVRLGVNLNVHVTRAIKAITAETIAVPTAMKLTHRVPVSYLPSNFPLIHPTSLSSDPAR